MKPPLVRSSYWFRQTREVRREVLRDMEKNPGHFKPCPCCRPDKPINNAIWIARVCNTPGSAAWAIDDVPMSGSRENGRLRIDRMKAPRG